MNYKMSDLYLSPKFAYHLSKTGQLEALIIAFTEYRSKQNYPFELKDKRIAKQAIFKGLCDFYSRQGFNTEKPITPKDILKETNEIMKDLWNDKEKNFEKRSEKESTKMVIEKIEKEKKKKEEKKPGKTYVLDIKGRGKTKDFHAECQAESKEKAYDILLKEYPGIGKSKLESVLKIIKLKK